MMPGDPDGLEAQVPGTSEAEAQQQRDSKKEHEAGASTKFWFSSRAWREQRTG